MAARHLYIAVLLVVFPVARSFAAELPPRLKIGDEELVLNGSGAREKYFMEMYVAGLYLPEKSHQAAEIVKADSPMALRIHITSRMVSQDKLIESLNEGFANSTKGRQSALSKEIQTFRRALAGEIKRGDYFDFSYSPKSGVSVFKNGKETGTIEGLPFKQALFGIWLGDKPADRTLKAALLGRE